MGVGVETRYNGGDVRRELRKTKVTDLGLLWFQSSPLISVFHPRYDPTGVHSSRWGTEVYFHDPMKRLYGEHGGRDRVSKGKCVQPWVGAIMSRVVLRLDIGRDLWFRDTGDKDSRLGSDPRSLPFPRHETYPKLVPTQRRGDDVVHTLEEVLPSLKTSFPSLLST